MAVFVGVLVIALYYLAGPQKVGRESRLFIGALISMCVIFTFIFTPFTVPDEDYHFSASHCLANFLMGDGYQSEDPVTMREDDAWSFQSLSSLLSSGSYNRAVNSAAGLFGDSKGNTEVITGRSHSITASMPQTKKLCSWNRVCKTVESVFLLAIRPWATFQFSELCDACVSSISNFTSWKNAVATVSLLPMSLHLAASYLMMHS